MKASVKIRVFITVTKMETVEYNNEIKTKSSGSKNDSN